MRGGRVLVAGIGNVLRRDDGFGIAVLVALGKRRHRLPSGTKLLEVGIGGIGLIQELMEGYGALVMVDAVERDEAPGTVWVLDPAIPDMRGFAPEERRLMAIDMHEMVPSRVLALAAALDVLPPRVRIVGCQPAETEDLSTELTPAVAAAVPGGVDVVLRLVRELSLESSHA